MDKNGIHKAYMNLQPEATKTAFFRCHRLVQQRLREMQDAWMVRKTEEIQRYVDRNVLQNFVKVIKAIYGPCITWTAPLFSSDSTKSQILKHWAEHFLSVLNRSSTIFDAADDWLPQLDTNNHLNLPPFLPETIRAVQQMSSGYALGSDAIALEIYKHGWPRLMVGLNTLLGNVARRTSSLLFQRRDYCPFLKMEGEPATL
ncbi:unnamed protein product [Schistocephalus solidus]|uniref:Uncharacterized protein n=1 Tax=Schistocephalus solidus TaxID=70667 RepID=A0A183TGN1_SCHSO|nr:unnamed protein product [Schistocephalus solidus]